MAVPGVVVPDVSVEAFGGKRVPPLALEKAGDGVREAGRVCAGSDEARVKRREQLRGRADRGAENGSTAGKRFGGDEAETFQRKRRQDKQVGGLIVGGELVIGDEAQEPDTALETEGLDQAAETGVFGSFAADEQKSAGSGGKDGGHGLDQVVQAHAGGKAADREKQRAGGRQLKGGASGRLALRGGDKAVCVSAAGNKNKAAGGNFHCQDFAAGMLAEDNDGAAASEVLLLHAAAQKEACLEGGVGQPAPNGATETGRLLQEVIERLPVFHTSFFVPGSIKRAEMRDLRRENLKGADGAVGEVRVGDVEALRPEQALAGIPAGFEVGTEAAGGDGVADDASAVQDGVGGRLAFFGPDQKRDGVAASGKAVSKLPRNDARAAGLILKDKICKKEDIHE